MADPQQQYTDAQLSDGTTLRFLGDLNPDQVRTKVSAFRLKRGDLSGSLAPAPMPGAPSTQPMQPGPEGLEADPNNPNHNPYAGVPGAQPMNRPVQGRDLVPGAIAGGAAAAVAAPTLGAATLPFVRQFAAKHPVITMMAAQEGIHQLRQTPGVGRFVPAAAEWLPFLLGGGKEAAKGEQEPPPSTDQLPGRPYQPNPRFEPRPEPQPLPARQGPLLLKGQVQPPAPEPTYPGASEPTATPEQLNPAINSPVRNLPGQISAERIYGPRPTPAQPIPQRQGLMLEGEVQQPTPYKKLPWMPNLEKALGNEPGAIKPGVPIRQQQIAQPMRESSAVQDYGYDEAAKEFHVMPKGGGTGYIYGDVSPEQARAFDQAESKGQAWKDLRDSGSPPVAKIINGQRVAIKTTAAPNYDPNNLTDVSTRSVRAAKQGTLAQQRQGQQNGPSK